MTQATWHERTEAQAKELASERLKLRILHAINRQAKDWGITFDQAQTLLLDRRMPA